jgi:L-glutamine-phosphate cytidylyltransferase
MNNLKAIILAAGQGERLRPLTANIPKCMVDFFGKSILKRQIDIFQKLGIDDISVVTGYCDDKINVDNIKKFKNKNFMTTNMVESLFTAEEKLTDSVIVSYGDIIFESNIIQNLIDSRYDISVVVDKNWRDLWNVRFENPLDDAESLVLDKNELILELGQKVQNIDNVQGQFIGLMKFQNDGLIDIIKFYKKMKLIANSSINPLNPNLPFEKSFMTDFLQGLIQDNQKLNAIIIKNGWLEIDSLNDYSLYQKMYLDKSLNKLISFEEYN